MLQRQAESKLKEISQNFKTVAILGPRQCGKTTLAKIAFPEKPFVSFDDANNRSFAQADPLAFIQNYPEGAIFDEIQKTPELFDAIKLDVDSKDAYGRFILTGSSQFSIHKNIRESLAGRIGFLHLLPLSISELVDSSKLPQSVFELAVNGFYPEPYKKSEGKNKFNSKDFYANYCQSYLSMDARELINVSNLSTYETFIKLCAFHNGQVVNFNKLASQLGVSAVTVKKWISILEACGIIYLLKPYYKNFSKKLIKTPKMYFLDSGLVCHLLGISSSRELVMSEYKGPIIEGMVISELLKLRYNKGLTDNLYYYRDKNGLEVDVIAEWDKHWAAEVKSNEALHDKYLKSLDRYCERVNDKFNKALFYSGDMSGNFADINYYAWKDWGKAFK